MKFRAAIPPLLFSATVALLAAACLFAYTPLAGGAVAVYLLSRGGRGNFGRLLCAAGLLLAASFTAWGALFAVCLLLGAQLADVLLAERPARRAASLFGAALALKVLLFAAVPNIAPHLSPVAADIFVVLSLAAAAVVAEIFAAVHQKNTVNKEDHTDPFLAALLSLFILSCALAAALLSVTVDYANAVLLAAAGACALLAALALLSAPFTDMHPSTRLAARAVSPQAPLEEWVAALAAHAAAQGGVEDFAKAAATEFLKLPGIVGVAWKLDGHTALGGGEAAAGEQNAAGEQKGSRVDLHSPPLAVRLFAKRRVSPWEWFNYYLFARIAAEYCIAKRREERNRADNLVRAVYETGSRLTHDIKNILHALAALTQVKNPALVQKQLPVLRGRLEATLNKLRAPEDAGGEAAAAEWWEEAKRRYAHRDIVFAAGENIGGHTALGGGRLPAALFDRALDNFAGNALDKRQQSPDLQIKVTLANSDGGPTLTVADNGNPVPPSVAGRLFTAPVASPAGFGVALYQVAQEAKKHHHTAALQKNQPGEVIFALRPAR